MAASGDLYDLNRMDAKYITPLIQAGALQNLDDYMEYAPDLTENFSGMLEYSKEYMSAGNEKVFMQFLQEENQSLRRGYFRYGNFIRWDWYKEAGSPEIQSQNPVRKHMVFPDLMTGD